MNTKQTNGVSVHSSENTDVIFNACKNFIQKSKCGGKVLEVKRDHSYGGSKVYLDEEATVRNLLKIGFLYDSPDIPTVHPLYTHFTVRNVIFSIHNDTPNEMAATCGVFIRSDQSHDKIIAACNNLINDTTPGGKILSVKKKTIYGGWKVYLNEESVVQKLIRKQFLYKSGDLSTIHPLVTHLTVHDAEFSTPEEKFIENLREKIRDDLGPVREVSKIPISLQHPDVGDGNWRVILDVPEIEDLDIFQKVGLPDNYSIDVPETIEKSSVTFHCTSCGKDGHSQWRCFVKNERDEDSDISQSIKEPSEPSTPTSSKKQEFFIRDREEERQDLISKSKPLLPRKKIREFESTIGKEEASRYCRSFPVADSIVKKETEGRKSSGKQSSPPDEEDENRGPPAKKASVSFEGVTIDTDDDCLVENFSKASSTTNDHSLFDIGCESMPSTPHKLNVNRSTFAEGSSKHSAEDSVSTSNQPEAVKSELPSIEGNDSDSNCATPRKRKKPTQGIPVVIPERIKQLINDMERKALDVKKLEAFLNHVKKKAKPRDIAAFYTDQVDDLKKQLEEILRQYYEIPVRGNNEEIQFMKWFQNTVQRFDGVPSTRKKKGQT
ncbi:uncharacterized protein NPIL_504291 [Nephila pilipes]|uniref:Uncharacterized protein n=1 Tax=Nephila pilipes TaxID=299642 RepID=A0A8X6NW91_NEPPI|nr:uncharacterized protein NPIL_504291 [Nephila pilipes]